MKKWLPCFMMLVTLVVQAQSGTDSAREVVEGSLIGFVQAPVGKALPELFMAPDGKPDLIFLPRNLSVNNIYRQRNFPEDNNRRGQMIECQEAAF